ncbi:MAG TPA: Flp pilus assembly protein CpaB [Candidatus Limnocylindrales bacterium]
MEMEFKDTSKRGRYIIILGIVLALAAGGAAFYLITQAQSQAGQGGGPKATVVVAARAIAARKTIEAADLTTRQVVADDSNAGAFTSVDQAVGRVSGINILQGQVVSPNLLASTTAGGQFSILGPGQTIAPDSPALRAISLNIPDDRAVGGQVQPGENVDVFVTVTVNVPQKLLDSGTVYTDKSTKVTYQDVPVLAKAGTFYIIRVDEATAEEIAHLQASGTASFSLALRPDGDTRTVDTSKLGETTNKIIEQYGLPIPQVYPR